MKRYDLLLMAFFGIALFSSCDGGEAVPFEKQHGGCDKKTFASYCKDGNLFYCGNDYIVYEEDCVFFGDEYRCIEDDFGAECRSNHPEKKPYIAEECQHNPDGDGIDYKIEVIRNPDNDNYWEVRRRPITDGLCYEQMVVNFGDESLFYSLFEGIMGCNLNTLYFISPVFTGKKTGLKEYRFYSRACKNTERCDDIAGCIGQCINEGEKTRAISWPNSMTSVDVECKQITNHTSDLMGYYYVSPKRGYELVKDDKYIYYGIEKADNPDGQACGDDYLSKCIGNVAVNCMDGQVQAIDCKTALCITDYSLVGFDESLKENLDMHRAWCSPLCQKDEIGKKVDACYFLSNKLKGYENVSTTFECSASYSYDNTPSYVPTAVTACKTGCDQETGKCGGQ
ncbi:MAG: hypothetical protein IKY83_13460 [Proteobacteria bacterium]|nr:hypothetical protein [Pseudomonadota bacterium]